MIGGEQIKVYNHTIYIGETSRSRSIYAHSKENWEGARKGSTQNHMVRHQELDHDMEPMSKFFMRIVNHHKSAPWRRGGGSLNMVEEEEAEVDKEAR